MLKIISYIGLTGFIFTFSYHISTFYFQTFEPNFIILFSLFFCLAMVYTPVIFILREGDISKSLEFTPKLIRNICKFLFIYALFSFFYTIIRLKGGVPDEMNNEYVLANHGAIIEVISETDYLIYKKLTYRGLSSFFMFFYALSTSIIYSKILKIKSD